MKTTIKIILALFTLILLLSANSQQAQRQVKALRATQKQKKEFTEKYVKTDKEKYLFAKIEKLEPLYKWDKYEAFSVFNSVKMVESESIDRAVEKTKTGKEISFGIYQIGFAVAVTRIVQDGWFFKGKALSPKLLEDTRRYTAWIRKNKSHLKEWLFCYKNNIDIFLANSGKYFLWSRNYKKVLSQHTCGVRGLSLYRRQTGRMYNYEYIEKTRRLMPKEYRQIL